jgi:hypothetical protein
VELARSRPWSEVQWQNAAHEHESNLEQMATLLERVAITRARRHQQCSIIGIHTRAHSIPFARASVL